MSFVCDLKRNRGDLNKFFRNPYGTRIEEYGEVVGSNPAHCIIMMSCSNPLDDTSPVWSCLLCSVLPQLPVHDAHSECYAHQEQELVATYR